MNRQDEQNFNCALGFRLMRLRQSHKMTQAELGITIGIHYQQIQKYEAGKTRMPPDRIAACARVLNVPIEYFFGTNNEETNSNYHKAVLTIAGEIMALPNDDIRKTFYHLARMINKCWKEEENKKSFETNKASA